MANSRTGASASDVAFFDCLGLNHSTPALDILDPYALPPP
jgi:hypothetical protein